VCIVPDASQGRTSLCLITFMCEWGHETASLSQIKPEATHTLFVVEAFSYFTISNDAGFSVSSSGLSSNRGIYGSSSGGCGSTEGSSISSNSGSGNSNSGSNTSSCGKVMLKSTLCVIKHRTVEKRVRIVL
jgi:hypothetical protein